MDLEKVLQQLHEELANLNAAISSLERLQEASKHRGQEAEWLAENAPPVTGAQKRQNRAKPKGDGSKPGQVSEAGGDGE